VLEISFLLINFSDLFAKRSSHAFSADQLSGILFLGNHYGRTEVVIIFFFQSLLRACTKKAHDEAK